MNDVTVVKAVVSLFSFRSAVSMSVQLSVPVSTSLIGLGVPPCK